jgi:hypothetical protein
MNLLFGEARTHHRYTFPGVHEVASRGLRENLHKRLVEHLEPHLSAEMSERAARSIGSVIDAAIAKLEAVSNVLLSDRRRQKLF